MEPVLKKLPGRDGKREPESNRSSQQSRKSLSERGPRNNNDNVQNNIDGGGVITFLQLCISQEKPGSAAVTNKSMLSVAKVCCSYDSSRGKGRKGGADSAYDGYKMTPEMTRKPSQKLLVTVTKRVQGSLTAAGDCWGPGSGSHNFCK